MINSSMQAITPKIAGGLKIRRALPACVACIIFIVFLSNADSFGGTNVELSYQSTLMTGGFPRKIWQTWKVDPLVFDERDLATARSWTSKNPDHRYEVLTDQNDLYYVETHFGPAGINRPDIVYMYRSITAKIIKADLLRYLVMYVEGGVYTDIDVEALKPVNMFIPHRYNERDLDIVIGVEIDQPEFNNHTILGKKSQSFCQWTFMCKPRLPVMMRLINNIMEWLSDVAKRQNVPVSEIELDFDEVISGTGPSAFTNAVLAEMTARNGQPVYWDSFHNMGESKVVGGVLVLTIEAFAAGQGHSDSGNHNARTALVKHHYHASGWPTAHPRYNHPVYGEVEKCNWDVECVKTWDANKATFDALPAEEQAKQIAFMETQAPQTAAEV
jgi:mannosyltransferase OCH1-like enzyme